MLTLNPQYIKDAQGAPSLVVLPAAEFDALLQELEDVQDVALYDEARSESTEDSVSLKDYLAKRGKPSA